MTKSQLILDKFQDLITERRRQIIAALLVDPNANLDLHHREIQLLREIRDALLEIEAA